MFGKSAVVVQQLAWFLFLPGQIEPLNSWARSWSSRTSGAGAKNANETGGGGFTNIVCQARQIFSGVNGNSRRRARWRGQIAFATAGADTIHWNFGHRFRAKGTARF
jgi:hypothetical protein